MSTIFMKRSWLQKYSWLIAIVVTLCNFALYIYGAFLCYDIEVSYNCDNIYRAVLGIIYEVMFYMTFWANTPEGFAAHVFKFFIPAAVCSGGMIYWVTNIFQPKTQTVFWKLQEELYVNYADEAMKSIVVTAFALVFFGALICVPKYNGMHSNWLKKHIHK